MPYKGRLFISNSLAVLVYFPLSFVGKYLHKINKLPLNWPLKFYIGKPFYMMRNDSLDRFGTSIEKRFSRKEIKSLFVNSGFSDVVFSDTEPFWCACGIKKNNIK